MIQKTRYLSFIGLVCLSTILGCIKKTDPPASTSLFNNSIFISCEGAYGKGNAGVTVFNRDTKNVTIDIYSTQNQNIPLGDVCQSLTHIGNLIYCIVNTTGKIEVVNATNFKEITKISCSSPRYMTAISDKKAYYSDWATNDIGVIDIKGNTITKRIAAGTGPEAIIVAGNYAYVANCGSYTKDSTVTVIDTRKDSVVQTIKTGLNPCAFAKDKNGYIWILCSGYSNLYPPYDFKNGLLMCIDPLNNSTVKSFALPFNAFLPRMGINSTLNTLFINSADKVYAQSVDATAFDNQSIVNRSFYSIGFDPTDNTLYASRPDPSYNKNGYVIRYTSTGKLIDSFQCGINAGNFLFQ